MEKRKEGTLINKMQELEAQLKLKQYQLTKDKDILFLKSENEALLKKQQELSQMIEYRLKDVDSKVDKLKCMLVGGASSLVNKCESSNEVSKIDNFSLGNETVSEPVLNNNIKEIPIEPMYMSSSNNLHLDYAFVLKRIEEAVENYNCTTLRPTIINVGTKWRQTYFKSLISKPEEKYLESIDQSSEKSKTFDLLNTLSRSGSILFEDTSFHVIIASTHFFDNTLLSSVIEDNINPIEEIERSSLILSSSIHGCSIQDLISPELDR